jgi:hypothetical protein
MTKWCNCTYIYNFLWILALCSRFSTQLSDHGNVAWTTFKFNVLRKNFASYCETFKKKSFVFEKGYEKGLLICFSICCETKENVYMLYTPNYILRIRRQSGY